MKFQFIKDHFGQYVFQAMLNVLQVTKSGYYAWLSRPKSKRTLENEKLEKAIKEVHAESRGTYGSQRVKHSLEARGIKASRPRVARIMKTRGLRGKSKRKYRVTTNSKHKQGFSENRLARAFGADKPNLKWVSDITYLPTSEGWLYLAVVLDLFSRKRPCPKVRFMVKKVIGWAFSGRLEASIAVQALEMARISRNPSAGLLHHSDRGVQYAARDFQRALERLKAEPSMSRKGNCWDNAVVESFFGTLKLELDLDSVIGTRAFTTGVVFEWIEVFYNRQRLHSTLGFKSPAEFEQVWSRDQMPNFLSTKA